MNIASGYFLNALSLLSHSEGGFGLNSDIFETNIINLAILWFGLFTFLKDPLAATLSQRKETAQLIIQDAEEQLEQAKVRLADAERQASQLSLVLDPIRKEADIAVEKVRNSVLAQGKRDIESIALAAKKQIFSLENQMKEEVFFHIVNLSLKRVQSQLETDLSQDMQLKIIDASISRLGGLS